MINTKCLRFLCSPGLLLLLLNYLHGCASDESSSKTVGGGDTQLSETGTAKDSQSASDVDWVNAGPDTPFGGAKDGGFDNLDIARGDVGQNPPNLDTTTDGKGDGFAPVDLFTSTDSGPTNNKCTNDCVPTEPWCHDSKTVGVCGKALDGCYHIFRWPCPALQACNEGQCVCTGEIEPSCSAGFQVLQTSQLCGGPSPSEFVEQCDPIGCWGEECLKAPEGNFVNILPTGSTLTGVWLNDQGLIAVGDYLSVAHEVNGLLTGRALSGLGVSFTSVSGLPSGVAFAVGRWALWRYEGGSWSMVSEIDMPSWVKNSGESVFEWKWDNLAVWAASSTEVYHGGKSGTLYRFDGAVSTPLHHPHQGQKEVEIRGIWGSGPGDVYVVGLPGVALHYDGKSMVPIDGLDTSVGGIGGFKAIDGLGTDDVYLLRDDAIWRFHLGKWAPMDPAPPPYDGPADIAVTDEGHIYVTRATKYHWFDGQSWHTVDTGIEHGYLRAADFHDGRVVMVGQGGLIMDVNGVSFSVLTTPSISYFTHQTIEDVHGTDDGAVFAVGTGGRAYRHTVATGQTDMWDLSAWVKKDALCPSLAFHSSYGNSPFCIGRVWASSSTDAYLGSKGLIAHFDGVSWKKLDLPWMNDFKLVTSISGSGKDDVYIGGYAGQPNSAALFIHWDGTTWTSITVDGKENPPVGAVWAEGGEVFAIIGVQPYILQDGVFQLIPGAGEAFPAAHIVAAPTGAVFVGHGGHGCPTNCTVMYVRTLTGTWHRMKADYIYTGDGIYHATVTPKGNFLLTSAMGKELLLDVEAITAWTLLNPGQYIIDNKANDVIFRPQFDYDLKSYSVWVSKTGDAYIGSEYGNVIRAPVQE